MKLFIFTLLLLLNFSVYSAPGVRKGYFTVRKDTTLRKFLYYRARLPKKLVNNKRFLKKILKLNPHISFKSVKKGQKVFIEIPKNVKLRKKRQKKKKVARSKSTRKFKKKQKKRRYTLSAFYATSFGTFTEEVDGVTADTNQNSPITLGVATGYRINKKYAFSGSAYFSTLEATSVKNSDEVTDIPMEYGLTGYLEFKRFVRSIQSKSVRSFLGSSFTPYIGADFERFSTFNTDEINQGEDVTTRQHQVLYFTAGLSRLFMPLGHPLFMKASVSQSLYTQANRKSLVSDEEFTGQKWIFFLASPVYKNWAATFLFKQHFMEGPTSLSVTRYGFGLSYKFF